MPRFSAPCPVCGRLGANSLHEPYCPHCGAGSLREKGFIIFTASAVMVIGAMSLIAGTTAGVLLNWSLLFGGGMFVAGLVLLYFYLKRPS